VLYRKFYKTRFCQPRMMGFILTVLVTPFLASTARPECGNYVHIVNNPKVTTEPFASSEKQPFSSERRDTRHGPKCSPMPDRMPLHPIASNLVPGKLLASLTPSPEIASIRDESYALCVSFSHPVGHPSKFERPPRRGLP